jgi:hypothetical protein
MNATCTKMTKGFDAAKVERFIAKEIRSMKRLRDKGHHDFAAMTDAGIVAAAATLARIYNVGQTFTPAN